MSRKRTKTNNPPWQLPGEQVLEHHLGYMRPDGRIVPSIQVPLDAAGRPILPPHLIPPDDGNTDG